MCLGEGGGGGLQKPSKVLSVPRVFWRGSCQHQGAFKEEIMYLVFNLWKAASEVQNTV